jgi:hypothetical protein
LKKLRDERQKVYFSPNKTGMIKSKKIQWTGNVARVERRLHTGFRQGSQKERDQKEELDVDGKIILNWILGE